MITNNGYGGNCFLEAPSASALREGTNLISDGSCGGPSTDSFSIGLAGLGYHGGPTKTHALTPLSPAIDQPGSGNCFNMTLDQRGYQRPVDMCDVGAYEFSADPGGSEILPTPAYGGAPPVRENQLPLAFDMPVGVSAGGIVSSVVSGADADGDSLEYELVTLPSKGSVGWDGPGTIPGAFTYRANASASGRDTFRFRVCDLVGCSAPATVNIFIDSDGTTQASGVQLVLMSGGQMGPLTVVAEADVEAVVADQQFTSPYGAFFFDVTDIPLDTGADMAEVVVILPAGTVIPDNAVVRKLDRRGVWHTLQANDKGGITSASINHAEGRITLRLRDNDMFDLNLTPGRISDPVALSLPSVQDDAAQGDNGGGGGLWHPALLVLLGLGFGLRRRFRAAS